MAKVKQGTQKTLYTWIQIFACFTVFGACIFLGFVGSSTYTWIKTDDSSSFVVFAPVGTLFLAVPIFLAFLMNYLRRVYYYTVQQADQLLGIGVFPHQITHTHQVYYDESGGEYIENPSKCKICERHPIDKKYHITKVHNLGIDDVDEYFFTCECNICLSSHGQSLLIG